MKTRPDQYQATKESFSLSIREKFEEGYRANPELLEALATIPTDAIFRSINLHPSIGLITQEKDAIGILNEIKEVAGSRFEANEVAKESGSIFDAARFETAYAAIRAKAERIGSFGGIQESTDKIWEICTGNEDRIRRIVTDKALSFVIPPDLFAKFAIDFAAISIAAIDVLSERFNELYAEDQRVLPAAAPAPMGFDPLRAPAPRAVSPHSLPGSFGGLGSGSEGEGGDRIRRMEFADVTSENFSALREGYASALDGIRERDHRIAELQRQVASLSAGSGRGAGTSR